MTHRSFLFILSASLLLVACDSAPRQVDAPDTYYPLQVGQVPVSAQLAISLAEQRKGLMHRTSLDENDGMLFIYPQPKELKFWMKNTTIPLDIGFFDKNGMLVEIQPLYPRNLDAVISQSAEIQFALEVNRGWFAEKDLRIGSQLNLQLLASALKLRGYRAKDYFKH